MNGYKLSVGVLALLPLIFVACSRSGADVDEDGSHPAENKVMAETPAPLQPVGKELLYT